MTTPSTPTRLSSKGQVIIPKALRDAKRWAAGMSLVAEQTTEGILLRPAAQQQKQPAGVALRRIQERIGYQGKAATPADMQRAVEEEAARRGGR